MGLLDGRNAVVTGAARGIGLEIATAMIREGAGVVLADIDDEACAAAAQRFNAVGGHAIPVRCDVALADDVQDVVARCSDELGSINIMVNNAGVTRDATMRKMTIDDFTTVIDVHLKGTWLGTRTAAARMREQGGGSIINLSSISGKIGNPGQTNYSAAKAGIVGLTKAAAKEVGFAGVRVNAIAPGLIRTPMTAAMTPEAFAARERDIPLGRAGKPSEVAGAALFLASDLSSYVTGIVLEVAGGRGI